jgi:hypothetical protein
VWCVCSDGIHRNSTQVLCHHSQLHGVHEEPAARGNDRVATVWKAANEYNSRNREGCEVSHVSERYLEVERFVVVVGSPTRNRDLQNMYPQEGAYQEWAFQSYTPVYMIAEGSTATAMHCDSHRPCCTMVNPAPRCLTKHRACKNKAALQEKLDPSTSMLARIWVS